MVKILHMVIKHVVINITYLPRVPTVLVGNKKDLHMER